ncbi:MAG: pirin family protein [Rhodanobacter sp.]
MTNTRATASESDEGEPCATGPVLERIATRAAEVGQLPIHRALPSRQRRMVGAWCFLDHAGPIDYAPGQGLRVGPHPHIGLQTFTWMIQGQIMHRDSLGSEQVIRPGQVNLMTAGRGISHAEDEASPAAGHLHAVQLWIALPDAQRHCEPAFRHYPQLPLHREGGFQVTVLAGSAFGQRAPAQVYSPLLGLDVAAAAAARLVLPLDPGYEHAVLVVGGVAEVAGESLGVDELLYLGTGRTQVALACTEACHLVLIGGAPFGEDVLLWWNFVARTTAEMEQATADWNARRRFGEVIGSPSPHLVAPDMDGLRLRDKLA